MEEKFARCGQNVQQSVALPSSSNQSNPAAQIELVMQHLSQWAQQHLSSTPCTAQPDAQMRRAARWGRVLSGRL